MNVDPDLTFLASCSNEDLDPIVKYVVGADTNMLDINEHYKANVGNHLAYVGLIVKEIREFGGNTFANTLRGDGVDYAEIVRDVAGKLGVKYEKTTKTGEANTVEEIELKILTKILEDSLKKMSDEERGSLEDEFRRAGLKNVNLSSGLPLGAMLAQGGVRLSGFIAYRVAVIVANAVAKVVLGRGLSMAGNALLTRAIGVFAGPIGWAVTGIWTAVDLAGPAYRLTIPVVCHVAYLRQKKSFERLGGT
ncbi:MAG TPA: DUF3944 domain-containing protein [Polyangiaceae bacterium]|jgi:uncharacterized protein YaaW (UPF0174 family)|nr:DUF3944 domain-containing protein [Polyangiaceae bacterium]